MNTNELKILEIEREAFELAVQNEGYDTCHLKYFDDTDSYELTQVQDMWWAWQARAKALQSSEPVAKQPWPSHNWCVGCDPDNCSGCGTEPNERRKQASVPLEKYNKLLDALNRIANPAVINNYNDAQTYRNIAKQAIAEAEGKEG